MKVPKIANREPYAFEVAAGKKYAWCSCGMSKYQPLCDGSHKGSGMFPVIHKAEKDETVYFCGCKQTSGQPMCDGSHNDLS